MGTNSSALLPILLMCLVSCGTLHEPLDANPGDLTITIKEADASIERLTDADHPILAEEFVLNINCILTINNATERPLIVRTQFLTPFDGLFLDIQNKNGVKLATTSHVLSSVPSTEPLKKLKLIKGITTIRLRCDTPVGSFPPVGDFPYVPASKLTQEIKLLYHGSFPGTPYKALKSNAFPVTVIDKTVMDRAAIAPQRTEQ